MKLTDLILRTEENKTSKYISIVHLIIGFHIIHFKILFVHVLPNLHLHIALNTKVNTNIIKNASNIMISTPALPANRNDSYPKIRPISFDNHFLPVY